MFAFLHRTRKLKLKIKNENETYYSKSDKYNIKHANKQSQCWINVISCNRQ